MLLDLIHPLVANCFLSCLSSSIFLVFCCLSSFLSWESYHLVSMMQYKLPQGYPFTNFNALNSFTRMEALGYGWMTRREFHALYGNICTLKELLVGQHHAWIIAWNVGFLTKQGGAIEDVLHSARWLPNRRFAKPPWRVFQDRQLAHESMNGKDAHWANLRPLSIANWIERWSVDRPKFQ